MSIGPAYINCFLASRALFAYSSFFLFLFTEGSPEIFLNFEEIDAGSGRVEVEVSEEVDVVVVDAFEERVFTYLMFSIEVHIGLIYKAVPECSFNFVLEIMFLVFTTTFTIFFLHLLKAVDADVLQARSLVHEDVASQDLF